MGTKGILIILWILLTADLGISQTQNVFLDRAFWKTGPTVGKVKQKIDEGNDPTAKTPFNFDGTVYAILENAPIESIKFLLEQEGNEVTKMTHDGRNYLMWAAYAGNVELFKYLVKKGSDTKIIDDHGYSVITFGAAAGKKDPALYDAILANGAKIDETNHDGANVLHLLAPHIDNLSELDYFIKKGLDIGSTDNLGNNLFNYAAKMGNTKIMDQLVSIGMDYKTPNKEGANAMIYAGYGGRGFTNPLSTYQYLDKLGIKANVVTKTGETPLHSIAYGTKDKAIFDFFLDKGVDIDQVNAEGNTAFLNAVSGNNLEIAKYLFPKVGDIDHKNKKGYSALTFAIINKQPEFFDFLISKGADVSLIDKEGNNLAYYAFKSYDPAKSGPFLKTLKSKGVDLVQTQGGGNTLFHLAIGESSDSLLSKAKELGVDINQKNDDGLTPLHLAAMKVKDETMLKWLLANGADKGILTDFEESAFDLASENELLAKNGTELQFLKK